MNKAHERAVLEALAALREATFRELFDYTDLPAHHLDAALYRLTGLNRVRRLPGGRYRATDLEHSRRVKQGLFLRQIPKLCLYTAPVYPALEHLQELTLWVI